MSKRRYTKGPRITSVQAAIDLILSGETIWYGTSPKNAAFMQHLSLAMIQRSIRFGDLHLAMPVKRKEFA